MDASIDVLKSNKFKNVSILLKKNEVNKSINNISENNKTKNNSRIDEDTYESNNKSK